MYVCFSLLSKSFFNVISLLLLKYLLFHAVHNIDTDCYIRCSVNTDYYYLSVAICTVMLPHRFPLLILLLLLLCCSGIKFIWILCTYLNLSYHFFCFCCYIVSVFYSAGILNRAANVISLHRTTACTEMTIKIYSSLFYCDLMLVNSW